MEIGALMFPADYAIRTDELAVALEERGFESLWVPEHTHIPTSRKTPWPGGGDLPREYSHTDDPFVCLSFAAARTSTLKLGTGICLLPQRDTITTAKAVASLDRLSGGRFLFGIGAGWNQDEMEHHGTDYATRFRRMEEQLQAMNKLWTEDEPSFHGEHVDFSPSWLWPKPAQQPRPPMILGGETDYTLERIVRYADGWLPRARGGFDAKTHMDRLASMAERFGRDMAELSVNVFGASPDADSLSSLRDAGVTRAILPVPPVERDKALELLDRYSSLL